MVNIVRNIKVSTYYFKATLKIRISSESFSHLNLIFSIHLLSFFFICTRINLSGICKEGKV